MRILDICHKIDELFMCNDFNLDIVKSGSLSALKITNANSVDEIEFCRVGDIVEIRINGNKLGISASDADKILSPYIGKRLFISLFH